MSTQSPPKKQYTPDELAALRKKVVADPNTKVIADSLKVPFEEYVNQVMHFLAHPAAEPQLQIVPDAELEAKGVKIPKVEEVKAYFDERLAAAQLTTKSKFADPNSQRERVTGALPTEPPATAKPEEVRDDLKAEFERERTSGKFKKF
ncbi:MAG: hypothetical protein JNK82_11080 [Myxococcaceae bacterium]|nr:hypothetical protein [Myxococcaceae bacterium]